MPNLLGNLLPCGVHLAQATPALTQCNYRADIEQMVGNGGRIS